jgi:hypothetical protein
MLACIEEQKVSDDNQATSVFGGAEISQCFPPPVQQSLGKSGGATLLSVEQCVPIPKDPRLADELTPEGALGRQIIFKANPKPALKERASSPLPN